LSFINILQPYPLYPLPLAKGKGNDFRRGVKPLLDTQLHEPPSRESKTCLKRGAGALLRHPVNLLQRRQGYLFSDGLPLFDTPTSLTPLKEWGNSFVEGLPLFNTPLV
jgi:hypothetical protein